MKHIKFDLRSLALIFIGLVFITPNVWLIYFNQNYVYPKRCLVDFIIALVTFSLAFEKNIRLPQTRILQLVGGLFILKVIATLISPGMVAYFNFLEFSAFGVLCLYFSNVWQKYNFQLNQFYWYFVLSALAITGLTLWQYVTNRIINGRVNPFYYSGPFGNINMMVEFLVFLLPMAIYFIQTQKKFRGFLVQFITVSWIFFILAGQSRSALLGLILIFLYSLYRRMARKEWAVGIIAVGLYFGSMWIPTPEVFSYSEAKVASLNQRFEIYKSTTSMLLDNPLGVGPAGFEFSYMPYQMGTKVPPQEDLRYDSPHNELLKWGIENGWAFLIACIAWWAYLGWFVLRSTKEAELRTFYRTSYLVMGPQIVFQFPFDNPASFLALSFIIALIISSVEGKNIELKKWMKAVIGILATIFLIKAVNQTTTRWIESQHFNDKSAVDLGCKLDPTNWRVCFYYAYLTVSSTYSSDALPIVQRQLELRPFDFLALRALGFYHMSNNNIPKSCEVAKIYDTIFSPKSFYTPYIESRCKQVATPIPFIDSSQFNDEYRAWVKKQL